MINNEKQIKKLSKKSEYFMIIIFFILVLLNFADQNLLIPKYSLVQLEFNISETAMGLVTTITTLVSGAFMVFWGYYSDKVARKYAMFFSSIIWSIFSFLTYFSINYIQLLLFRSLTGIGLGCVLPIGFSVISDIISPERRSMAFAFWGVALGFGAGVGYIVSTFSIEWRTPFLMISIPGFIFSFIFLFLKDPERGRSEREFKDIEKLQYNYKINRKGLSIIWKNKTNRWMIIQGIFGCIPWGVTQAWLPYYFSYKFSLTGISSSVYATIGAILGGLFMAGAAIGNFIFGYLGDKIHKNRINGRVLLSTISVLGGIPLIALAVLIPFNIITPIPNSTDILIIFQSLINEFSINFNLSLIFLFAFIGSIIAGGCGATWYAATADVNLPEHRGTVMGISNTFDTIGRGLGPYFGGILINYVFFMFKYPYRLDLNLTLLVGVLFWVPCGLFWILTLKTVKTDMKKVHDILENRAKELKEKNMNTSSN
ncbi:MAG: MFS transporter [Candidatus Helarchaeota archaeon]